MKNLICLAFLFALVFSTARFAMADDELTAKLKEAEIRTAITLAIQNAYLYQNYLIYVGANHYELAKNDGFIETAKNCLETNNRDYCYFAVEKLIKENPYYSGGMPMPAYKNEE